MFCVSKIHKHFRKNTSADIQLVHRHSLGSVEMKYIPRKHICKKETYLYINIIRTRKFSKLSQKKIKEKDAVKIPQSSKK